MTRWRCDRVALIDEAATWLQSAHGDWPDLPAEDAARFSTALAKRFHLTPSECADAIGEAAERHRAGLR